MNVRQKSNKDIIWFSDRFNVHSLSEVIIQNEFHGADSEFIKNLDVFIENKWYDFSIALQNHKLITDNYNTKFFLPTNPEDKKRGFTL